jgi:TonB-linked SusC/RagA family outer membrane protein
MMIADLRFCSIRALHRLAASSRGYRILVLLLTVQFFFFTPTAFGEQDQRKLTLSANNIAIQKVFQIIKKRTGLTVFYSNDLLNDQERVSVDFKDEDLTRVLDHVLRGKGISYEIRRDKVIVLSKVHRKEESQVVLPPQATNAIDPIWVKGRVTDGKGGGLPGVSVLVKGSTRGTSSDSNGNFTIDVPNPEAVLVFSFVGYVTKEIKVGNRTDWNIFLDEDEKALEELVVVGFGERNRRDLTGSISTVNADLIGKSGGISPQYALQGNTTGVRVINTSGNPNEAPQIFIRGIGTWNGDSQPLYVVDGQILEPPRAGNEDLISGGGLRTPPNLFNLINSGDIESISVLKDASAAAVYGSRAANGVVLITTKRGKKGAPKLEFNTRIGVQNSPRYKLLNTTEFVALTEEMYANTKNPDITIAQNLYGRNEPNDAVRLTTYNPQFDPQSPYYISDRTTYDWQDEMLRNNAKNQTYDVKVSGANDRIDYYVSAGLYDYDGVIYGNSLKRLTGAVNLNIKVTNWAKVGINYKYTQQKSTNNRADLPDIADVAPWQPIYDSNNKYGFAPAIDPYLFGSTWQAIKIYGQGSNLNYRAVTDLDYNGFDLSRNLGQFYLELKPFNGLTVRGSLNLDYTQQDRLSMDAWSRNATFSPTGIDPRLRNVNAPNSLGSFTIRATNVFNYQSDLTATYDRIFGEKHHITLLAGGQDQRHEMENFDVGGLNLTNFHPNPKRNGWGGDLLNTNSLYGWGYRYWFGMVGRASYDYANRYYLDASYRRDASNGFAKEYRWGNFYSVSGAWRISSESFFQVPFISDLKIRGGWGQAGNDQAAVGRYAYLSRVSGSLSSYGWGSGNGNSLGNIALGGLVNDFPSPELSWEVATTTYVGADAYLLKNKLNLTFEWYHRLTSGILQTVNLPLSVGTGNPLSNIGEMVNKGVDLSAGYEDRVGDFRYNISGNISFVKNKVTKLYNGQPLSIAAGRFEREDGLRIEEGRSVGIIWGYKVGGIFQTQEQVEQHFANQPDNNVSNVNFVGPGDMYFLDVHGDPTEGEPYYSLTPDGKVNSFDQTEIGNTIPGHTYGLTLSLGWKGFDLSAGFYGEGNVQKYNAARRRFESMNGAGANYFASTLDRWTPSNTQTDIPRAVVGDPAANSRMSDRWVENAAFFRLNNWQIGYNLPPSALQLVNNKVSSFRIYIGGENNLYAFRWRGIDPVNDAFPLPKTFSAGLNVSF